MNVIPVVSVNKISKTAIKEALGADRVEFVDWDKFFYIKPKKGRPIQDPEWPSNFIKAVRCLVYETEGLKSYKNLRYVFINAGPKPLKYLVENKIPFVITMPRMFEGKYAPVEHYGWLNSEYLSLDMPMIYLDDDEYLNIFKRESTYKYLVDKIDFVEAYRFGTCVFSDDLDEFDEMFERHNSIEGSAEVDSDVVESVMNIAATAVLEDAIELPIYTIKDKSGEVFDHIDGIANCFNTLEQILLKHPDEEYLVISPDGEEICKVYNTEKGIMIKKLY